MPDNVRQALEEVRDTLARLYHDPSPDAPEVPFWLREALDNLFAEVAKVDAAGVL